MSSTIAQEDAEKEGKEFWEIFKSKAVKKLCDDKGIMKLIKEGKIKEALLLALPPILVGMGLTSLFIPAASVIVAGLIMLLIETGIESLCEMYGE